MSGDLLLFLFQFTLTKKLKMFIDGWESRQIHLEYLGMDNR